MSIHGDDVVREIRKALADSEIAPSQTFVETTPNPDQGWRKRDGRHEFFVVGRDWFRAFRVTVETLDGIESGLDFAVDPLAFTEEEDAALRERNIAKAVEEERERLAALPTLDEWINGTPADGLGL